MALISSRELTERHNISYQTLNFYTTLGLFEIEKRVGNRRFFDEETIRTRLERIFDLKDEGFPLRMIVRELQREYVQKDHGVNGGSL